MRRASAFVTGAAAIASPFLVAFAHAAPGAAEENGLAHSNELPHQSMTAPSHAETALISRFCVATDPQAADEAVPLHTPAAQTEETPKTLSGAEWSNTLIAPLRDDAYFEDMLNFMDERNVYVCKSDTLGAPSKTVKFGDDGMFLQLDPSRSVTGLQRQRVPAGDGGAMFAMLTALRTEMSKTDGAEATVILNETGLSSMRFNPNYTLDDNHLKLRASYIDHLLYIAEASLRLKEVSGDSRLHDFLRQFPYPPTSAVGLARDMEDALRASLDGNNHGEITAYNRRAVFDEFFARPNVFVSLDTTYPKAFMGQLTRNGYNAELGRDAVLPENFGKTPMALDDFTNGEIGERQNGNYLDGEGRNIMTSDYYRLPPFDVDNALAMMQVRHALNNATYSKPATNGIMGTPGEKLRTMEASYDPI